MLWQLMDSLVSNRCANCVVTGIHLPSYQKATTSSKARVNIRAHWLALVSASRSHRRLPEPWPWELCPITAVRMAVISVLIQRWDTVFGILWIGILWFSLIKLCPVRMWDTPASILAVTRPRGPFFAVRAICSLSSGNSSYFNMVIFAQFFLYLPCSPAV